jgi:hypothetical protein
VNQFWGSSTPEIKGAAPSLIEQFLGMERLWQLVGTILSPQFKNNLFSVVRVAQGLGALRFSFHDCTKKKKLRQSNDCLSIILALTNKQIGVLTNHICKWHHSFLFQTWIDIDFFLLTPHNILFNLMWKRKLWGIHWSLSRKHSCFLGKR